MPITDRRFALLIAASLLAAAAVPYLWAEFSSGTDHVFGGLLFNPIDGNTYFAKAHQGRQGHWRFRLPYTAEPGDGAYINLYYLFIGHLARWTGLSIPLIYNLARLTGVAIMLAALWSFYKAVLEKPAQYRTAFGISALALGMGWLLIPTGLLPMDLWVTEAYPLLSALTNPHFPLALALIVVLANPVSGFKGLTRVFRDVALALALSLVSPFGVPIALLPWTGSFFSKTFAALRDRTLSLLEILRSQESVRILAILAGGLPVILYDVYAIRTDPVLSVWDAQNVAILPAWWDIVLSLSPALPLAVAGFQRSPKPLKSWFVLGLLLALLPFGLQRRFLMGLYIPLAGMATLGLESIRRPTIRFLVIACFLPAPLLLFLTVRVAVADKNPVLYLHAEEREAMAWIEANTAPDALILAAPETGLFIPAYTGRRVIYGHPFETIHAEAEKQAVESFFSGLPSGAAGAFLDQRGVDYVFIGPRELQLGPPPDLPSGRLVYSDGDVQIYATGR
ncbi:MAG TPA: hypothetical protein VMN57_07160 [Anaerolineales bacterium]|nr:hypothetical protein [Anaerolineales bacterium]